MTKDILVRWEEVLDKLEQDPRFLVRELDWVAKRHMIESYRTGRDAVGTIHGSRCWILQYHDVRPEKGLYYTLERSNMIERVVAGRRNRRKLNTPRRPGRAPISAGIVVKKFPQAVYAASWTSVLFDIGNTTIKRVPLMDPLRGTESLTRDFWRGRIPAESLAGQIQGLTACPILGPSR